MQIFKYRHFSRWAKSEGITDALLRKAVVEMEAGLLDADLGGGLYKKRVARSGRGKRSGYRTLLAFKKGDRAIFVFGFAKNERDNIGPKEKDILKSLAQHYLNATAQSIRKLINNKELIEVK